MTIKESIMNYIKQFPGATDTDIEKYLKKTHQTINQAHKRQLLLEALVGFLE